MLITCDCAAISFFDLSFASSVTHISCITDEPVQRILSRMPKGFDIIPSRRFL